MHLQQTKRGSRGSGGPQYYFHNLSDPVKTYLRKKGAVSVALLTPYGATKSDYYAVSTDRKFDGKGRIVHGKVGHDRVQQGTAGTSIGESIRRWYNLQNSDFERIDIDVEIIEDRFYITPLIYRFAGSPKEHEISRIDRPLTFTVNMSAHFGGSIWPIWINNRCSGHWRKSAAS
ncbi:MAG TPA: hypothetical protein VI756_28280 [Blastocatellia bacterium]